MTVRACTSREERDKATLRLLDAIERHASQGACFIKDARDYESGQGVWGDPGDRAEAERRIAEVRHLAAKLAATYGPEPVRVVPAEAVVDTGEHEPEDDGQPTNEELREAAKYEALVTFWGEFTTEGEAA
jgi:hypothetical protein